MTVVSRVWLSAKAWTIRSMEFSRPECCSGWPFPSPGGLSSPETEPKSLTSQADALQAEHQAIPRTLEWVADPFSSRSSWPRNRTGVSCIAGVFFTNWVNREASLLGKQRLIGRKAGSKQLWRGWLPFSKTKNPSVLWLIHADVWQKPAQYCQAIILQLKINLKKTKENLSLNHAAPFTCSLNVLNPQTKTLKVLPSPTLSSSPQPRFCSLTLWNCSPLCLRNGLPTGEGGELLALQVVGARWQGSEKAASAVTRV